MILFTISEYYDRDRSVFYRAIQSVRENKMDLTGWLEYFVTGLATQMQRDLNRLEELALILKKGAARQSLYSLNKEAL
jgi:Fic family protein